MQKLLLAFVSLGAFALPASSQWDKKNMVREWEFTCQTKNHFYNWSDDITDNSKYNLHVFNEKFDVQAVHETSYKKMAEIAAFGSAGNTDFLYVVSKEVGDLYAIDASGKNLTKKTFVDDKSGSNGAWISAIQDSPILVQSSKVDKPGFIVNMLSPSLETVWSKTFEPEKGQFLPKLVLASAELVFIVYESKKEDLLYVKGLSKDGSEKFNTVIGGAKDKLVASVGHVDAQGNIFIGGHYGAYEFERVSLPAGAFSVSVSSNGTASAISMLDFKAKTNELISSSDMGDFGSGAIAVFMPQTYSDGANGVELIGETCLYKSIMPPPPSTPSPTPGAPPMGASMNIASGGSITLYDVIIWNIAANKVHRIHKPKRTIEVRNLTNAQFTNTVELLQKAHEFSIVGTTKDAIYSIGWNRQFQYVSKISKGDASESSINRVFFGKPILGQPIKENDPYPTLMVNAPKNYATNVVAKYDLGKPLRPLLNSGAVMFTPGEVIVYEWNTTTYNIQSKIVKL